MSEQNFRSRDGYIRPRGDYGGTKITPEEHRKAYVEHGFGCGHGRAPEKPPEGGFISVVTDSLAVTGTEVGEDGAEQTVVHEFTFSELRYADKDTADRILGYLATGTGGETPEQ